MDYSQFLLMHHEIGILIVFLLVFLFDTFLPKSAQSKLSVASCVLFGLYTLYCFFAPMTIGEAFAGMYATSPIVASIKNILNVGLFLVLLQSIKWNDSESQLVRRGEFIELLLVTLFGMYLMVSARHFLIFVIGLETASLPLAAIFVHSGILFRDLFVGHFVCLRLHGVALFPRHCLVGSACRRLGVGLCGACVCHSRHRI